MSGQMRLWLAMCFAAVALNGMTSGQSGPSWPFPRSSWPESDLITNEKKKSGEEVLGSMLGSDEKPSEECFGKQCLHSDQCCKGAVCVDVDGIVGTCLPIYGQREGESCRQDSDCEDGLRCSDSPNLPLPRTCVRLIGARPRDLLRKKQYNDECLTSGECDVGKGLCCQVQRRHRQAPRKVCYYFADPKSCIGRVDPALAKPVSFSFNPFFKARMG